MRSTVFEKNKFLWIVAALSLTFLTASAWSSLFIYTDAKYVESLNLPTNADSVGIPIFSALFGGMILAGIAAVYYTLIKRWLSKKTQLKTISAFECFSTGGNVLLVAIKYALIGAFVYLGVNVFIGYEYVNPMVLILEIIGAVAFVMSGLGNISIWSVIIKKKGRS